MAFNPPNYAKQTDQPLLDKERGSMFDMFSMPLVFAFGQDGKNIAEIFDFGTPTIEAFNEMFRADATSRKLLQALTLPVRRVAWTIEPVSKSTRQDVLDNVTSCLTRPQADGGMQTPMGLVIDQHTSAFPFRRAYFEKVFTQDDYSGGNKVCYSKIAFRPQDSCIMLRDAVNGEIRGFKQRVPLNTDNPNIGNDGYVPITQQYSHIYVHNIHLDSVFGASDFDVAWNLWQLKTKVLFLWGVFLESTGLPRIVFSGSSEDNAKKGAMVLAALQSNGVAGIPSEWHDANTTPITPLPVGAGGGTEYHSFVEYIDGQMADSLLLGFTGLATKSMGTTGSYSLSRDASAFFLKLMQGYANEMQDQITNGIVQDLVRYNFGKNVEVPRFKFGPLNQDDIQLQVQMLQALGVAPNLNPNIPVTFLTDLVFQIARAFDMDLDQLKQDIQTQQAKMEQEAETQKQMQLAQLFATAQAGVQAVSNGQQQRSTPTAGTSAPTNGKSVAPAQ